MVEGDGVDGGVHPARRQQGLGAGGETQAPVVAGPVEGLDAEAIAGQEQDPAVHVPEAEGEHAVQALAAALAPGMPGLEDDLRVTFGEEAVTLGHQVLAQFAVVVDGAVEDQGQAQFRVHHRLVGADGQVDDAQAPVAQAQAAVAPAPAVIRPAPLDLVHHPIDRPKIRWRAVEAQLSADTTHGSPSPGQDTNINWPLSVTRGGQAYTFSPQWNPRQTRERARYSATSQEPLKVRWRQRW